MKALASTMLGPLRQCYAWLMGAPFVAQRDRQHVVNLTYLAVWLTLIGAPLFGLSLFRVIRGDHDLHLGHALDGIERGHWPVHFMFPAIIYTMTGFSHDYAHLAQAAIVLLTACLVAKGCMTYAVLVRACPQLPSTVSSFDLRWSRETLLLLVAIAILLATPILRPWEANRIYIGQVSPNIWHNPTILVSWPLAMLLFFAAWEFLRAPRAHILPAIAGLAALSVVAKPNYFLAFAPAFGLASLWRLGLSRMLVLSQLAMLPTVAVLLWQLTASFGGSDAMRPGRAVALVPLAAWHMHSKSIPLSLVFSLAFPLSYIVVFRRSVTNRGLLAFAWLVMLSALVWMACFAEVSTADGSVDGDFNFSWGSHLALFLLFLVTAIDMCNNRAALSAIERQGGSTWQAKLPWWLLGAHAVSGVIWLARQFAGRGYL